MSLRRELDKLAPDSAPNPRPGFETYLLEEVTSLVAGMPPGTAQLKIGRFPNHPEYTEPYFEIVPANPRAASIKGVGVTDDLNLTIGEAAWRELIGFARGGTIIPGYTWQAEFQSICLAVIKGDFTENVYRNAKGEAIGSALKLPVNGKELVIRHGRKTEKLFGHQRLDTIVYEPYVALRQIR
jgi:hypothetical protein